MSREIKHSNDAMLRDRLALDRTRLANQRTFLAYLRTPIVLVLAGLTVLKLFESQVPMVVVACVLLAAGVGMGLGGGLHSLRTAQRMKQWGRRLDAISTEDPGPDASGQG